MLRSWLLVLPIVCCLGCTGKSYIPSNPPTTTSETKPEQKVFDTGPFPTGGEAAWQARKNQKSTEELKKEKIAEAEHWIKWHIHRGDRKALLYKTHNKEVDDHVTNYLRYKEYKVTTDSDIFIQAEW